VQVQENFAPRRFFRPEPLRVQTVYGGSFELYAKRFHEQAADHVQPPTQLVHIGGVNIDAPNVTARNPPDKPGSFTYHQIPKCGVEAYMIGIKSRRENNNEYGAHAGCSI